MPEILGMSDRIIVVREGRIVHESSVKTAEQEELMAYAFGTKHADRIS
jgi:ribose transport system ATP-binding protein